MNGIHIPRHIPAPTNILPRVLIRPPRLPFLKRCHLRSIKTRVLRNSLSCEYTTVPPVTWYLAFDFFYSDNRVPAAVMYILCVSFAVFFCSSSCYFAYRFHGDGISRFKIELFRIRFRIRVYEISFVFVRSFDLYSSNLGCFVLIQ